MENGIGYTDPKEFNAVIKKLRSFFDSKGFLEVHEQSRPSILAACEDPTTLASFDYNGEVWPLFQTTQMWLEWDLLNNESIKNDDKVRGLYSLGTSYRNEPNPKPGRHQKIFPLFDFEMKGGYDELVTLAKELCEHLGYKSYAEGDYMDIAKKYGVERLDHCHEEQLYKEHGPVYAIKHFPDDESFFNMARFSPENGLTKKCDFILSGQECFGMAERSCDTELMREKFRTITEGKYAETLYAQFGKERVDQELERFLSQKMISRSGGGIGIHRLIRSLKLEGLLDL